MAISFDTNHKPVIGEAEQLEYDLVVITADNASPMTFTGTRTYVLGTENLIIIDPGPDSPAHLSSIMKYIGNLFKIIVIKKKVRKLCAIFQTTWNCFNFVMTCFQSFKIFRIGYIVRDIKDFIVLNMNPTQAFSKKWSG